MSQSGSINSSSGGNAFTQISIQQFTVSGTYTPTVNMKYCTVEAIGGGGGGGGAGATGSGQVSIGSGGSSGGYCKKTFSAASIGSSQSIIIGNGGAGGIGASNGMDGTSTTFGAFLTAGNGGHGFNGASSTTSTAIGGTGNSSTGGDINLFGNDGFPGIGFYFSTGSVVMPGSGSGSFYGASRAGNTGGTTTHNNGNSAYNYGSGGSGASNTESQSAANGGAGSNGFVIITEFI